MPTDRDAAFYNFVRIVDVTAMLYIFVYLYFGYALGVISLLIGLFLLARIAVGLSRLGYSSLSRLVFVLTCDYYILSSSLVMSFQAHLEYYCLAIIMLCLLVFEFYQVSWMIVSITSVFISWFLIDQRIFFDFFSPWMNHNIPFRFFVRLNFIGSFFVQCAFLVAFLKMTKKNKETELHLAQLAREEVERALARAQLMQQELIVERARAVRNAKLASLAEMATGIAHEINNPLAIISGSVHLLPKVMQNPEKLAFKLTSIQSAIERISNIVLGLKKFAQLETDKERSRQLLSEVIQSSLILVKARAAQLGVELILTLNVDPSIHCNRFELEQVFTNLINNALDIMPGRDARWVKMTTDSLGAQVRIRVIDSGTGIPEAVIDRIFDPFFTTKGVGGGTGLGLSVSKGILADHGATIEVRSDQPHTCFEIQFPIEKGSS